MADYKEKFEQWQKATKDKFDEIDRQLGLKDKFEEGAKAVKDAAQKVRTEAEKSESGKQAVRAAGDAAKTAGDVARTAWDASGPLRDAAGEAGASVGEILKTAGSKAGEVFNVAADRAGVVFDDARGSAESTVNRLTKLFGLGASWTRTIDSAVQTVRKTTGWIQDNPLQAATTGVSVVVGAGLGAGFTLVSSHWLFSSALPVWSIKKAGEQFNSYLKKQEELIASGELSKADAERVEFERDIVKRVGAPLLGAFSFASGAMLMTNIFNPKTITGAPIDWLIGGSPLLEGVWFFGNGIICFKTSYDFFMIALEDQAEVQRMVKEIKGLLPQPA
jgi:ElaB/YqjD/DUF883 family membrane-anchored ribosome-binding protein